MTSILLDSSGLHDGGAVQVAVSFLDELAMLINEGDPRATWPAVLRVEASTAVASEIAERTVQTLNPVVVDRHPTQLRRWLRGGPRYDVSFVIFGPEYGRPRAARRVVGFADGTSIFPRPTEARPARRSSRARAHVRGALSRYLHSQADLLVTETKDTATALKAALPGADETRTAVVPNALNGILTDPSRWQPVNVPETSSNIVRICYVARAYPHKNHAILSQVARIALQTHALALSFVVTLTDKEWSGLSKNQRYGLINVGRVRVSQVPSLLQQCDAAIFPSLLESFSTTPLEAMALARVLFASDRPFVRQMCGDAPVYIDPHSPARTAQTIADVLRDRTIISDHITRGLDVVAQLATARDRTLAYLHLLHEQAHSLARERRERRGLGANQ